MPEKNKDSTINLVVNGRIPSKKNSTWNAVIKGRLIRLPSQKYKEWNKEAVLWLRTSCKQTYTIQTTQCITLTFYMPDKRVTDLSNKCESVMDTLVDAEMIEDDNCSVVPKLILVFGGVDKSNPRCEIKIEI